MNTPTQTTKSSRQRPKVSSFSSMDSVQKLGLDKLSAHEKSSMLKSYYDRRQILKVPQDILDSNPDKVFCFINMNKLEKTGFWHPQGYKLYKTGVDTENMVADKFNSGNDGLVHRNEMVLAYLPKEEWEQREMEQALVRATKQVTDVLTENEALRGFSPFAKQTTEQVRY